MSDAATAYAAAREAIRREIADDEPDLSFSLNAEEFRSLESLPPEFEELPALHALTLDNTQVADLEPLRAFTDLQVLSFCNTPVVDLGPIRAFTSLRYLSLDETLVGDLAPLQGLTRLERLSLDNTQVADLKPLNAFTDLDVLSLCNTRVVDLAPIGNLTSLRQLSLDNTLVSDLGPLQGLNSLRQLSLARTRIADVSPLQVLNGLRTLSLNDTKVLTDLRPISELTSLVAGGGLHFRGCAACALDPEGLGKLAEIEDDCERTERTLAYLRDLMVWPPVPPDPPEQDDLLQVAPNADGRLDVAPVHPAPAEAVEKLRRTLYLRLRAAFADLERTTGNQQPEVSRRARAAQAHLPEQFAEVDLVEIYLEIAWTRGEFDRRGEREGEDRFSNAAVAALDEILTVGPPIVLDNPDVETLEDRRRRFAADPLNHEAAAAQDALATTIAAAADAFGDTLRGYAAGSLHPTPDPADPRSVVQRTVTRNTVIAAGRTLANDARTGILGGASFALTVWLVQNQGLVLTTAAGWGEMLLAWLGPVFEQARAILAAGQAAGGVRPPPRLPKLP